METRYRNFFNELKSKFLHGAVTYDQAKLEAQPFIDEMNDRGKAIAVKYGKKFRPFTFAGLFR